MRKVFYISFLVLILASCRTSSHAVHHDSTYQATQLLKIQERVDSVWIDRWHLEKTAGDTVYKTDSIVKIKVLRVLDTVKATDTVSVKVCDTVHQILEKPTISKAGRWQIAGFWILAVAIILVIAWRIYRMIRG